jgi:hypothetical protein
MLPFAKPGERKRPGKHCPVNELRVSSPGKELNLTRNLRGDYLSAKIKNRKGEEGEKVLKERLKKGKTAQNLYPSSPLRLIFLLYCPAYFCGSSLEALLRGFFIT